MLQICLLESDHINCTPVVNLSYICENIEVNTIVLNNNNLEI